MTMGLKISRRSLSKEDVKKVLFLISIQYFVDSFYQIGSYIPRVSWLTQLCINAYSVAMISVLLLEARKSFQIMNLRAFMLAESSVPAAP
jgi:hypothetical protein